MHDSHLCTAQPQRIQLAFVLRHAVLEPHQASPVHDRQQTQRRRARLGHGPHVGQQRLQRAMRVCEPTVRIHLIQGQRRSAVQQNAKQCNSNDVPPPMRTPQLLSTVLSGRLVCLRYSPTARSFLFPHSAAQTNVSDSHNRDHGAVKQNAPLEAPAQQCRVSQWPLRHGQPD